MITLLYLLGGGEMDFPENKHITINNISHQNIFAGLPSIVVRKCSNSGYIYSLLDLPNSEYTNTGVYEVNILQLHYDKQEE